MLVLHILRHLSISDGILFPTATAGTCGVSHLLSLPGCHNPVRNSAYSFDVCCFATADGYVRSKRPNTLEWIPSKCARTDPRARWPAKGPFRCCKYFEPDGATRPTKLECPEAIINKLITPSVISFYSNGSFSTEQCDINLFSLRTFSRGDLARISRNIPNNTRRPKIQEPFCLP